MSEWKQNIYALIVSEAAFLFMYACGVQWVLAIALCAVLYVCAIMTMWRWSGDHE